MENLAAGGCEGRFEENGDGIGKELSVGRIMQIVIIIAHVS